MPGLAGFFGPGRERPEAALLGESLDLAGTATRRHAEDAGAVVVAATLPQVPLGGERLRDDGRYVAAFAGDLVGSATIPWDRLLAGPPDDAALSALSGVFALVVYDRRTSTAWFATDRRAQAPLFYRVASGTLLVSTSLATFCRAPGPSPSFDRKWLFELLYFNFPVSGATPLQGVTRAPAGSILQFDARTGTLTQRAYAPPLRPAERLLERPRSFELALDVFRERLPLNYRGATEIGCALTAGWDGRTVLAFAPPEASVVAYTYGVPGCADISGASRVARAVGATHRRIHFDETFVARLPEYAVKAAYLSSGLLKPTRATVAYAYETLTERGRALPLVLSGVSMDMQFRGHAASPALVSRDMVRVLRTGDTSIDTASWSRVVDGDTGAFAEHVGARLDDLRDALGPFELGSHHLLYQLYQVGPKYFAGEIEAAGHYTTVRAPAWDAPIVDLSLGIRESTLSYSEYTQHVRGAVAEVMLQAHLLTHGAPRFARVRIGHKRPDLMLRPKPLQDAYRLYVATERLLGRLRGKPARSRPLEDWDGWLNRVHRAWVDDLVFGPRSLVRDHVAPAFLDEVARGRDGHWLGKLLNAEIVLRLVRDGWRV